MFSGCLLVRPSVRPRVIVNRIFHKPLGIYNVGAFGGNDTG